jgi:hypothetical protein
MLILEEMTVFNVTVTIDHGHLVISDNQNAPAYIHEFVNKKVDLYCTFKYVPCGHYYVRLYEMKPNCQKQWTYQCGADVVCVDFKI